MLKQILKLKSNINNFKYIFFNSGVTKNVEEKEEVNVELPSKDDIRARLNPKEGGAEKALISGENEEAGAQAPDLKNPQEIAQAIGNEQIAEPHKEEKKVHAESTVIEEPIVSAYAQNNYWRPNMDYTINQLEADYA